MVEEGNNKCLFCAFFLSHLLPSLNLKKNFMIEATVSLPICNCILLFCRIIELNGHKPPLTYKRFQAIISRMELPKKPVAAITSDQMEKCKTEIQENHDETYGVPSLEELGMLQSSGAATLTCLGFVVVFEKGCIFLLA